MATITATIRLHRAPASTHDVDVIEAGPHEGQIDELRLSELVETLGRRAGHAWPVDAVYLEPRDDTPFEFVIIDASSQDSVGILTVHHGAGA